MDKRVTVKFWQIHSLEEGGAQFEDALDLALGADAEKRVMKIDGTPYQLEIAPDQKGPVYLGDVIRLQGSALPSRIRPGRKAEQLQLAEGEYLGHHTGFIYDADFRLLGFEMKPTAAGLQKVLSIVEALSGHSGFAPLPVILKGELARLGSEKNSQFSFKVADPISLKAVNPELATIRDNLVDLKEMVDATYLNITVGVGRRKQGLERGAIMQLAGWLLGERDAKRGGVKSVRAHQPGAEDPILDFVQAQVKSQEVLPLTGKPDKDWEIRSQFLQKALIGARGHVKRAKPKG